MSKKIYVDALFDQYEDLLQQMTSAFPEDPDWGFYRTGIAVLRRANPMMLATKTWECVSPYFDQIQVRDEAFFLTHSLTEGSIAETITKLRSMWKQMPTQNRNIVWDYITNITYLAKKCVETQPPQPSA